MRQRDFIASIITVLLAWPVLAADYAKHIQGDAGGFPVGAPTGGDIGLISATTAVGSPVVQNPGMGLGCPQTIRRGDANGDGAVDLADPIRILDTQFGGSTAPICEDAADANDDGLLQGIPDAITILNALFAGGTIPAPFPACGVDPTADVLTCVVVGNCP